MLSRQEVLKRMDKEFLEILACPVCQGDLELKGDKLCCVRCHKEYIFNQGIPVLLPETEKS